MKRSSRGFSLIELLVTVAVISMLAAIGMVESSQIRARAKDNIMKQELSTLYKSLLADMMHYRDLNSDLKVISTSALPGYKHVLYEISNPMNFESLPTNKILKKLDADSNLDIFAQTNLWEFGSHNGQIEMIIKGRKCGGNKTWRVNFVGSYAGSNGSISNWNGKVRELTNPLVQLAPC